MKTTTYTFKNTNKKKNNNKKFNKIINFFTPKYESTNYSKVLDDIILNNVIKSNSYILNPEYKTKEEDVLVFNAANSLKGDTLFTEAANFLANYNKAKKFPYILNKIYYLADGTPIMFYEDEVQIDNEVYTYDEFNNIGFLGTLTAPKKKIIIDIYTNGLKVNIKINK